jgi:hypothetical protein
MPPGQPSAACLRIGRSPSWPAHVLFGGVTFCGLLVRCLAATARSAAPHRLPPAVVTPTENMNTRWVRVYCPLGMADLFGAFDK